MKAQSRIRDGVPHSLTGTMANAGMRLVDARRFLLQAIGVSIIWFLRWLRQYFLLPKVKLQSVFTTFSCLIICVCLHSSVLGAAEYENGIKRVLVVNSYHPGYSWSDDIMNGVRSVLGEEDNVEVFIEYLDTKKHISDTYFQQMEQLIRYKYNDVNIDVIITSDDNALDFLLGMRRTFFKKIQLVFCGIDHIHPERISGFEPIYGVEESDGTRSTLDLILSIHPDTDTVFFVSDETKTGKVMLKNVRTMEPSYQGIVKFDYLLNMNADELQAALRQLPQESVVLYLSFIRDKSQRVFSVKESMKFIGNTATVPVYCTWGFQPDTGVIGGNILDGFSQGKMSAQIAMKLLHNEDVASIPSIQKAPLTYMFDYQAMRRFKIGIDSIPKNSVIYNKPFSIYREYRWRILGIAFLVIAQTVLVIFLLINSAKRKRAEEKLRYQATLLGNVSDAVASLDKDFRVVSWNDAAERIYGWKAEEVIGKVFREFATIEYQKNESREEVLEKLHRNGFWEGEVIQQRKDGERILIQATVLLIKDQAGNSIGYVGVNRDITERRKTGLLLEKSEAHLRRAQEVANSGSWELDILSGKLFWSDEVCRIFGVPPEAQLSYEAFLETVLPEDREYVERSWQAAMRGEPYDIEHRIRVGNVVKWLREKAQIEFDGAGRPTWGIGIVQDITDRKQAEEKIHDYQQRLKALASQLTIAEERERHRIATDLHDHVSQSLAFARIQVAAARKSTSVGKRNAILDDISETLLHTIQDTKNLTVELSAPSMNEIGLGAAISEWLEEYVGRRYGLKTEFIDEIDDRLRKTLDENVRAILFRNVRELLTNVVKHAYANQVSVSMENTDGFLKIVVQDDGIGFDYDSEFQAVKSESGFGLFSVQERMSDLGGSLEIVSEPGKGFTAILRVPLSEGQG